MKLLPLSFKDAEAIAKAGKRKSGKNPYTRFTTKWYVWKTGKENPRVASEELCLALRQLGYPIGEQQ